MNRIKLHVLWLVVAVCFTAQAQVEKSGSIFTATKPANTGRSVLESIQLDPGLATVTREITYCKVGATDLRMDAYIPTKPAARPFPALIYIHGGAWITGDKDSGPIEADLPVLLARGYAVVAPMRGFSGMAGVLALAPLAEVPDEPPPPDPLEAPPDATRRSLLP